jgi:hypothetical protein
MRIATAYVYQTLVLRVTCQRLVVSSAVGSILRHLLLAPAIALAPIFSRRLMTQAFLTCWAACASPVSANHNHSCPTSIFVNSAKAVVVPTMLRQRPELHFLRGPRCYVGGGGQLPAQKYITPNQSRYSLSVLQCWHFEQALMRAPSVITSGSKHSCRISANTSNQGVLCSVACRTRTDKSTKCDPHLCKHFQGLICLVALE